MKIIKKTNPMLFCNLDIGDTFSYCDNVFIRVPNGRDNDDDTFNVFNAYNLETNTFYYFDNTNAVHLVKAELIIGGEI